MSKEPGPKLTIDPGSWKKMLAAVPIRNAAIMAEWNERKTELKIAVPTRKPRYAVPPISWIVHPPKIRIILLDSVGASVWNMCDGSRTVENIIEEFAVLHGLTFHESRVSVTGYLKTLIQRGVLAVAME